MIPYIILLNSPFYTFFLAGNKIVVTPSQVQSKETCFKKIIYKEKVWNLAGKTLFQSFYPQSQRHLYLLIKIIRASFAWIRHQSVYTCADIKIMKVNIIHQAFSKFGKFSKLFHWLVTAKKIYALSSSVLHVQVRRECNLFQWTSFVKKIR